MLSEPSLPLLLKPAQMISNFPICLPPPAPRLVSPPTSLALLGSSPSAPTTLLLQEPELPMTKTRFCSSRKVLFRKLPPVYSHFCCQREHCLEATAGVETEGWCWGAWEIWTDFKLTSVKHREAINGEAWHSAHLQSQPVLYSWPYSFEHFLWFNSPHGFTSLGLALQLL